MTSSTDHADYQLLISLLKEARRKVTVSQVDLATRLGTTQTFISKVERGERRLDVVELVEIFEALNIAPEAWMKKFLQRRKAAHKLHGAQLKISM